ncbi:MalY/PatB family protein [Amphibacillus cookii]|uniref:MalY/PatB family protein n=1 Tax=Amphibacillus cookii TaxID=767787 RepID=UPI001957A1B1|nr:MalY/PatB family protein [Amphibacillus cookii]MBM7541419.1 cystathionine beta-lyase [Amphibacillus cookii]
MMEPFEQLPNRQGTRSVKWDMTEKVFGSSDIQPMWVADMDFEIASPIKQALIDRIHHGVFGYTITDSHLNQIVKQWLKRRHNWTIEADSIIYSPGVLVTIHMAILTQTNPGDKVLIQTPVYPPFHSIVKKHNRTLVTNPLIYNNGRYTIDYDDLEAKFRSGVKAFILCSPHNPVGRVWTKTELANIISLAKRYHVLIISDEIHADLIYNDAQHVPIGSIDQTIEDQLITCFSPTKTFNLAGLQVSYAVIANKQLRQDITQALADYGVSSLNTLGITALEASYQHGEEWLDHLYTVLHKNRQLVEKTFQERHEITPIHPEGTYLMWLDCRNMSLDQTALNQFMIAEARVGLNNGLTFGEEGRGFMRINLASPTTYIETGVNKMIKALDARVNKV